MQYPEGTENFDDRGGIGIMNCWVVRQVPFKCMNVLSLWARSLWRGRDGCLSAAAVGKVIA